MRLPTPTPQRLQHCHVLHVAPRSSTSIGKIPTHPLQQQQRASRQPHRLTCTVSAASTPTSTPQHTVRFSLCYEARFGQQLRLVGSVPTAGSWKPSKSLPLTWTEGNEWVLDVKLSAGTVLEYKYIVVDEASGEVHHWQPGDNLEVHIPAECMGTFVVKDDWVGSTRSIGVVDEPLPVVESAAQPAAEPASSRKDAEEAIAKADVGVFTYVEVLLNSNKSKVNGSSKEPVVANGTATATQPPRTVQERIITNGATTSSTALKEVTIPATAKHHNGAVPFAQDGADVDTASTIAPEESLPSPSGNGATVPLNGTYNGNGSHNGVHNGKANGVNGHSNGLNGKTVNGGAVNGGAVNGATTNGHSNNGNGMPNLLDKLRGVIWYGGGGNGNSSNNNNN